MSTISTAYDEIVSEISGVLTEHSEMTNPYDPAGEDDLGLDKSFGVQFGSGVNTELLIGCNMTFRRQFDVIITRKLFVTHRSLAQRKSTEKSLLEDHFLVVQALEQNLTLTSNVNSVKYISDTGIRFIRGETHSYIMVGITLEAEYFEVLS